jgi:hypothetical protein
VTVLHVSLLTSVGNASQFPLSRELLMQHLELFNELLTDRSKDIARGDGSVCLDSYEKLRNIGVSDCIRCQHKIDRGRQVLYSYTQPCRHWGASSGARREGYQECGLLS